MAEKKPVIAVPTGDPAGVGPEIVAKACAREKVSDAADVIAIGDRQVMEKAIRIVGADLRINVVEKPADGDYRPGILNLIDLDNIDQSQFSYGVVQAMCGKAAFDYIKKSIELAMNGEADAVATTPINKEALHAAEVPFIGHTEIFGALTNTPDPLTMFETNGLRVFFLTRHKSLRAMLDDITKDNIKTCVRESLAAPSKPASGRALQPSGAWASQRGPWLLPASTLIAENTVSSAGRRSTRSHLPWKNSKRKAFP